MRRGHPNPPFRTLPYENYVPDMILACQILGIQMHVCMPHRPLTRHCHVKDGDIHRHRVSYRASQDMRVTLRSRDTPCATDVDLDCDEACKVTKAVSRHEILVYGARLHRRTEPSSLTFVCIPLQKKESLFVSETSLANTSD